MPKVTWDTRVNITFLIGLILQGFVFLIGAVWWTSKADSRLTALETSAELTKGNREDVLMLRTQYQFTAQSLSRIESKIDRLDERLDDE